MRYNDQLLESMPSNACAAPGAPRLCCFACCHLQAFSMLHSYSYLLLPLVSVLQLQPCYAVLPMQIAALLERQIATLKLIAQVLPPLLLLNRFLILLSSCCCLCPYWTASSYC